MAGLLDYLFDPQTYSQAGGLLSRLQPRLAEVPQSQGFPGEAGNISVGGYQMPRLGNAELFNPQQANIPANAQPVQGQMQPQQQQATPSFLQENPGGFGAGIRGFVNNLHTGPVGALVGGIGSAFGMQDKSRQDTRALFEAYKSSGLSPSQATLATLNPKLAENMLGLAGTDDIKEYQFAKREDPSLTFEKFMARKKAVSGEFGMQPIWGTGADGKPAVLQLGKSGEAKQSVLPPGFTLARDPIKVDGPTGTTILDPQTRQQVGFIPKDVAGREVLEKRGQAQGTAQAALANGADIDAEQTKKKINSLLENGGLDSIVGPLDQFRPTWTLGSSGRDALARLEQLQGGAFLQAYSMLKGGGAITEIEGQKAERALARMQRSQSEEDFKASLVEFRDAIDTGLQKLRRAANGGVEPTAASSPPPPQRIKLNPNGTIAQ